MGQYNDLDQAVLGMKADNDSITRVESFAAQEDITFGYPVFGYLGIEEKAYAYHLDTAKVIYDADFVTGNSIAFSVNSIAITPVIFNTDHNTTMNDLLAAVTGLDGVDASLDPNDVNNRTLFVRTIGLDNTTTSVVTGGASQPVATITYQSDQIFLGVNLFVQKDVLIANNCKVYQNQTAAIINTGIIWSIVDTATGGELAYNDNAFLVGSGATAGKFSLTAGLDINCKFKSNVYTNSTTNDIIAKIEINGSKKLNEEIIWS